LAWIALAVLVLVGGLLYWRSQNASALTERDTIVLADFDNSTGAAVFDVALKQALTVDLEQSPFLNVLPAQKVREQIGFMGLPAGTALKEDVARQVCQRTGSKAMLMGSIAGLGSVYLIGLRAENCATGDVLAAVTAQAENREQVIKELSKAASSMRNKLGESLPSIQKYDTPIEQARTVSLEALQAYSFGIKTQETEGEAAAVPFFKHATELDPNFAMAYDRLGTAYVALNQPSLMAENLTKAFELRDRTNEKEKLRISGTYHLYVTGDLPRAVDVYKILTETYPRESNFRGNLAAIYFTIGKYEQAVKESLEATRLNPSDVANYVNSVASYIALDRFAEAKATIQAAEARKVYNEILSTNSYMLGFLTHDETEMKRQAAAVMGKPGAESQMLQQQSDTEAYFGRSRQAREYGHHAITSAARTDGNEAAATW
jgi:tetratricopeptide (TPR) repeat protein